MIFGLFQRRAYRARAKLVASNVFAAIALRDQLALMDEIAPSLLSHDGSEIFDKSVVLSIVQAVRFANQHDLPAHLLPPAKSVNVCFRNIHSAISHGQNQFRRQLGTGTKPLPFDQAYQPREGWHNFLAHSPSIGLRNHLFEMGINPLTVSY